MYNKPSEKNTEELMAETNCWNEIQAILENYKCTLTGTASCYDSDYDYEYGVSATDFSVVSDVYTARIEQEIIDQRKRDKEQQILNTKNRYNELKKRFSKYKDLKIFKVGTTSVSSFWFEGLYLNHDLVKAPLFEWNPNRYWMRHQKSENHHSVYISVDEHSDFFGLNGEPHFTTMQWHIDREEGYRNKLHVDWFKYYKHTDESYYIDMIAVCTMIDDLIAAGVLSLEETK